MSLRCAICERRARMSLSRSHSNVATKKRQKINLHSKIINGKRVSICSTCLRTINKQKTK
ncbi:MAG: 50S ribosomal protein L28 [Candidatus Aenigmarchaeota archaeon]|nr:50S ribosomal protein L28 [Candidatus Aenigmarchaeota archaeon]